MGILDNFISTVRNIGNTISSAITGARQTAQNTASNIGKAASSAGNAVKTSLNSWQTPIKNSGASVTQSIANIARSGGKNTAAIIQSNPVMKASATIFTSLTQTVSKSSSPQTTVLSSSKKTTPSAVVTANNSVSKAGMAVSAVAANTAAQGNNTVDITKTDDTRSKNENIIDTVVNFRDTTRESGIEDIMVGYVTDNSTLSATGVVKTGGMLAADVVLPLDLVNLVNKAATGRFSELSRDDWIYAAIDLAGIVSTPFTAGAGYLASRGAKVAAKGVKTIATVSSKAPTAYGVVSATQAISSFGDSKRELDEMKEAYQKGGY